MSNSTIHPSAHIAPTAVYNPETVKIGEGARVHTGAFLHDNVFLDRNVEIGERTEIGSNCSIRRGSVIGHDVLMGPGVIMAPEALIMENAQICINAVVKHSSNARQFLNGVSIGPNVLLHDEVELGFSAIVPSQRTIAHLGHLGSKNRVVTIYGSDDGPRYSIGCQIGIDFSTVKERVANGTATQIGSANTYTPFLGAFAEIGSAVQAAYEKETWLVEEIKATRAELGMSIYVDDPID